MTGRIKNSTEKMKNGTVISSDAGFMGMIISANWNLYLLLHNIIAQIIIIISFY